jgi:hypothetical protein
MSLFKRKPEEYKTEETPKKREDPYAVVRGIYLRDRFFLPYRYKVIIFDEIRGPERDLYRYYPAIEKYEVEDSDRLFLTSRGANRWAKRHLGWYIRGVQHQNHKIIVERRT